MSNQSLFQEKNTRLNANNTDLNAILNTINNLPEASGGGEVDNTYWYDFINNNLTSFENSDLTSIANYGLAYKTNLTSISLPNVTTLGDRALMQCTSCTSINLPALQTTGQFVFNSMTSLEEAVFPEVTKMSHNCFVSCSKIKKVDYHKITYFGFSIFSGCTNFETLIVRTPSVAQMGSSNLLNNTKIANSEGYIYVPDDLVEDYKVATNWSNYADQIKGLSELPS